MSFTRLCIAGCGDIGTRIALLALEKALSITAFVRKPEKMVLSDKTGLGYLAFDLDNREAIQPLHLSGSALIYLVPPPGGGIWDSRARNFLAAIPEGEEPSKIIYISTTSVYGDCGSDLITEDRKPNPSNHTGKRRLDAEERFREWGTAHDVSVIILRVAGIYGPGRIPMDRILNGHPLLNKAEAGYTNRIHADDLAQICLAALAKGEDGDIFNICDGETSKMNDYFDAITDLLGLERLTQVPLNEARAAMTPLMFGYMTESRRIDNSRMLTKLGIKLQYPTLKEGLKASL